MLADQLTKSQDDGNVDTMSTVTSYKYRSKDYNRNPLSPPREIFVNIPDQPKPSVLRKPFYID